MPYEPDTQEGGGRPAGDHGAMPDPAPRRLVETWRDGHVLVVALCRPEKRNAVDRALADAIDAALNELDDDPDLWVGLEQEYFLYKDGAPLGWPKGGFPLVPQGPYYCGVGYKYMGSIARTIVEEHWEACLAAGINHEGINAEVAKGQWEFQIFAKGSAKAADDTWTARYLLMRLCEKYEVDVVLHCKPLKGDWNGSGMHCNFSTKYLREVGGKEYFEALMKAFEAHIPEHIAVYGPDNHLRLTGLHETQSIDKFSYGLSDRGASIRMPVNFVKNGYKGYLEDRRPNSEGDPYQIVSRILKTINSVAKP